MTQTIHNIVNNTDTNITVAVYKHPNNSQASIDNAETHYCYTVFANAFNQDDLSDWVKNSVDFNNEYAVDELKELIELFAKNEGEPIWKCSAENGNDDYLEFHATKEDAEFSLFNQRC